VSLYNRTKKLFRERKSDVVKNEGAQDQGKRSGSVFTLYINTLTISYVSVLTLRDTTDYSFSWDDGRYVAITKKGVADYMRVSKAEAEKLVSDTLTEFGV